VWVTAAVLGIISGVVVIELGSIGALVAILIFLWAVRRAPRVTAAAGFVLGLGTSWLYLLIGQALRNGGRIAGESGSSDLRPFLSVALVVFALGAAASLIAFVTAGTRTRGQSE
jgi:hypothetical protein